MIIFRDMFTGDELFTDSNKIQKVAQSEVLRVSCTEIIKKESGDFDIGANASQEEAAEEVEDTVIRGIDIVINQHLEECTQEYSVKTFNLFLRDYCKRIIKSITDSDLTDEEKKAQTTSFKEEAVKFTKLVKDNFDDIQFFRFPIDYEDPKDITGYVIPLHRDKDTAAITMWFFRRGLKEEKC